jgi:hypothetical protein
MSQFDQNDRAYILGHPDRVVARKASRIVAVQMHEPFTVQTDRGTMVGDAGDYLVTNHPDDDPESDLWTISAERYDNTYGPAE